MCYISGVFWPISVHTFYLIDKYTSAALRVPLFQVTAVAYDNQHNMGAGPNERIFNWPKFHAERLDIPVN